MTSLEPTATKYWTAGELRAMSPNQRDSILRLAAEMAENDYNFDQDLTDFEAFGEEEVHGSYDGPFPG